MRVLAIESSGLTASVAYLEDDIIVGEYSVNYKKTHSQTLLPMIDEMSKMTEMDLSKLDCLAVSKGPGSFTGLRIGSATAKGIALSLNIPIAEIETTMGLAFNMYGSGDLICPIMDARRNQVYTGIYDFTYENSSYRLNTIMGAAALSIEEILEKVNSLKRRVLFLGDGVPVFKEKIEKLMEVEFSFACPGRNLQSASSIAVLGAAFFKEGKTVSADEHVPDYLRLSQAEREKKEREENND